jgi:aminoglycoside phosphotransferase (APT) family kinase protein
METEARVLDYVAVHGYPVPRVEEVRAGGTEIVMERLSGSAMLGQMLKSPASCRRDLRLLADLHDRLHQIPAPSGIPQVSNGDALLHLDLHPLNVMMTDRGPVVIDWTNAARGDPLTDVGVTYVVLVCPEVPAPLPLRAALRPLRSIVAGWFAERYRGPEFDRQAAFAAELKMFDPNMAPGEIARCQKLAERLGGRRG